MDEVVVSKGVAAQRGFDPKASLAQRAAMLKGLRIAVDAINTINHGFLRYVARKGGLDADNDITVAPMQSPSMAAALAAKSIDGMAISLPWTTAVIVDGSAIALASVPGGDFPELVPFGGGIVVTRPDFCRTQRDVCMKMGQGIERRPSRSLALPDAAAMFTVTIPYPASSAPISRNPDATSAVDGGLRWSMLTPSTMFQHVFPRRLIRAATSSRMGSHRVP
jgi:hypothetical protein